MNKTDLAAAVAERTGTPKSRTGAIVDAVFDLIAEEIANGEGKVTIVNFGTFIRYARAEKKGSNPKTGEPLKIPARYVAKFKPGKGLAERVAG